MRSIKSLFVTQMCVAKLSDVGNIDISELQTACYSIAEDDLAGQQWCEENKYPGYTSYASLTDLIWRFPIFSDLKDNLDKHVASFVHTLDFDLNNQDIVLEDMWINILDQGGSHGSHIHPHSAISGTTYVSIPKEAGEIRFEDPRLPLMMSAPPRKKDARPEFKPFYNHQPTSGEVLLWESWLRHEVLQNDSNCERVSISFNYKWAE
jgi:uncharacterized protein (TIGR02466 family)